MKCLYIAIFLLCAYTISGIILPIQKTDGSLDVVSLLSHIGLLEQSMQTMKSDIDASQKDLSDTKSQLQATKTELEGVKKDLKSAQLEIALLLKDNGQGQSGASQMKQNMSGATFIRWGRTSCPADSSIIYKGYTGGTDFKDVASSANILCLPDQPLYANHTTDRHDINTNVGSHIFGSEYHTMQDGGPFRHLYEEDMPCVVCESQFRTNAMMVAARNQCYPGWTLEYSGYLMGSALNHGSGSYICVDNDAEAIPGTAADEFDNGHVFYPVEGVCGSLPCPPYSNGWELTCVVCSK